MRQEIRHFGVCVAWLLVMAPAESARAIGLYFEGVATTASAICPAPCYQIRIFIEDFTRSAEIQAIQMDLVPD